MIILFSDVDFTLFFLQCFLCICQRVSSSLPNLQGSKRHLLNLILSAHVHPCVQ